MTKRTVTTTLYQTDNYSSNGASPPENAVEFIQWLSVLIYSVPEEYRQSVRIEFDDDGDYDRPRPQLTVSWFRPETNEEEREREALEKARSIASARDELARAERNLAAAKAKLSGHD